MRQTRRISSKNNSRPKSSKKGSFFNGSSLGISGSSGGNVSGAGRDLVGIGLE